MSDVTFAIAATLVVFGMVSMGVCWAVDAANRRIAHEAHVAERDRKIAELENRLEFRKANGKADSAAQRENKQLREELHAARARLEHYGRILGGIQDMMTKVAGSPAGLPHPDSAELGREFAENIKAGSMVTLPSPRTIRHCDPATHERAAQLYREHLAPDSLVAAPDVG